MRDGRAVERRRSRRRAEDAGPRGRRIPLDGFDPNAGLAREPEMPDDPARQRERLAADAEPGPADTALADQAIATRSAVDAAIAKQMPCAGRITAVLTPMTDPSLATSGPPEFPGLAPRRSAARCRAAVRSARASSGRGRSRCPRSPCAGSRRGCRWRRRSARRAAPVESPNRHHARSPAPTLSTARSECGSSPTIWAVALRPSGSVTSSASAAGRDVAVRDEIAVRRDQEAGPGAAGRHRAAPARSTLTCATAGATVDGAHDSAANKRRAAARPTRNRAAGDREAAWVGR